MPSPYNPLVVLNAALEPANGLTGLEKFTLCALALYVYNGDGHCWPSIPTLMASTEMRSEKSIRKGLRGLESKGWLRRQSRGNGLPIDSWIHLPGHLL